MSNLRQPQIHPKLRARVIAKIDRRRRPERQLLGRLALAAQDNDLAAVQTAIAVACRWPELSNLQKTQKAALLFAMTGLLMRAGLHDFALHVAPRIPFAPGMRQVMEFSTHDPYQIFCWRVTSANALVQGRKPLELPVETLIQPYQRGQVHIDHAYVRRVLLPQKLPLAPILLLSHPHGLVELDGERYIILDGNHRVVFASQQQKDVVRGCILTPQEGAAVLISHCHWPPYERMSSVPGSFSL
jgi:hypothetical protein